MRGVIDFASKSELITIPVRKFGFLVVEIDRIDSARRQREQFAVLGDAVVVPVLP